MPSQNRYIQDEDETEGCDVGEKCSLSPSWQKVDQILKEEDEQMIAGWTNEIDTLLVFAGLFSAVLTAFLVDTYKDLKTPSPSSPSLAPSPGPPKTVIRVNALWFMSLVLSLTSALFGILIKQWTRHYPVRARMTLRERVCLRERHFRGVIIWKVLLFVRALSLLLQLSLVLFFAGLLILLSTLDDTIYAIITSVVVLAILLIIGTSILPAFYEDCPYKSPLAWMFVQIPNFLRSIYRYLVLIYAFVEDDPLIKPPPIGPLHDSWTKRDFDKIKEDIHIPGSKDLGRWHHHALVSLMHDSSDDERIQLVTSCLDDLDTGLQVDVMLRLMARSMQLDDVEFVRLLRVDENPDDDRLAGWKDYLSAKGKVHLQKEFKLWLSVLSAFVDKYIDGPLPITSHSHLDPQISDVLCILHHILRALGDVPMKNLSISLRGDYSEVLIKLLDNPGRLSTFDNRLPGRLSSSLFDFCSGSEHYFAEREHTTRLIAFAINIYTEGITPSPSTSTTTQQAFLFASWTAVCVVAKARAMGRLSTPQDLVQKLRTMLEHVVAVLNLRGDVPISAIAPSMPLFRPLFILTQIPSMDVPSELVRLLNHLNWERSGSPAPVLNSNSSSPRPSQLSDDDESDRIRILDHFRLPHTPVIPSPRRNPPPPARPPPARTTTYPSYSSGGYGGSSSRVTPRSQDTCEVIFRSAGDAGGGD